jgi:CxxC motif-containing protein (DUF1111 family)
VPQQWPPRSRLRPAHGDGRIRRRDDSRGSIAHQVRKRDPHPPDGRGDDARHAARSAERESDESDAVLDSEIQRGAAAQATRTDGIHGRINYVAYASQTTANPAFNAHKFGDIVIGRFGLKARVATLDDFAADAFQNDMGITSPMRPTELPNPDGLTDDEHPGVDIGITLVDQIATYMRLTAIPTRGTLTAAGTALFGQCQCSVCHVPTLHTRADYPIAQLADIDAPIYSDLLLHGMGPALADGMPDGTATSSEFRTTPLIALKYMQAYLNDGRAHTLKDAIQLHGGEATASVAAFQQLSDADRATLLAYVNAL